MTYNITPNTTIKIIETSGTIQNISQINKVELSNSSNFTHSIILYPYETRAFKTQLYVRLFDNSDLPVEIRVAPFNIVGGLTSGTSSSTHISSDSAFEEMLDEIFGSDTSTSSSQVDSVSGDGGTVDIDGEIFNVISDDDFNSMLDDIGI